MGWEPVGKCIDASEQHSHTTRRLLDEDRQEDKRVFTGMHEILKTKIGKLEDTINTKFVSVESKMEELEDTIGKALEGRIAAIEGDMKEIKELLMQLVGSNNVEMKTNE